ncbi:MAG: hypothetical protein FJ218_07035 [Ignavibacteria bacterium]|nr:hypothetical protein [Ignavibacteria bacterium]
MGKIRKWNNILHRDIGYVIVALTLVYGISGIAVNHVQDWNPNFSKEKEFLEIQPIRGQTREEIIRETLSQLQISEEPSNAFRPDSSTLVLFFDGKTYTVDLPTGMVLVEKIQQRRVLYEMNQLHLNTPKDWWTYIADVYALSLIVVTITGVFVLKGKNGITGRGAWLTAIGIVIPLGYWIYYLYS